MLRTVLAPGQYLSACQRLYHQRRRSASPVGGGWFRGRRWTVVQRERSLRTRGGGPGKWVPAFAEVTATIGRN